MPRTDSRATQSAPSTGWRALALMAAAAGTLASVGCQSSKKVERPKAEIRVGPEAFARSAPESPVVPVPGSGQAAQQSRVPQTGASATSVANSGDGTLVVRSAPATIERPEPTAPEGLALIEAKVGDINGKPIYVTSFFEPIEARLTAESERLRLAAWRQTALAIIKERLDGIIMDELLRAEALAALSEQQRQGLRAFLSNFRRDTLSKNLGSAQLASQRGQNLDDTLREKEIETLVNLTLYQEISKRVNVSWRDIQQRYERDIDTYNPPPTAVFRLLRVVTDPGAVETMDARVQGGEPFEALASEDINTFRASDGGLVRSEFDGPFDEGEFFGSDELNEKARTLEVEQIAGPFELGTYTCWLKLEAIEQESVSLYDAQLAINTELQVERRGQTRREYFERLFERARVSNYETLMIDLLSVAEDRYGPE